MTNLEFTYEESADQPQNTDYTAAAQEETSPPPLEDAPQMEPVSPPPADEEPEAEPTHDDAPAPPTEAQEEAKPTLEHENDTPQQESADEDSASPPDSQANDIPRAAQMRTYWKKVLTGNPATVPAEVRDKAGVNDWDAPEEQKEYHLLATVNKSWAADHLPRTREQISSEWPQQREQLAHQLGVRNNEHELFLALSEEQNDTPRREAAAQIYRTCYMAGLDGKEEVNTRAWETMLSAEDAIHAQELARIAFEQGKQKRQEMQGLAERIAYGIDFFAALDEEPISSPRAKEVAPDLMRSMDALAEMDETQRNTALYLAAEIVAKQKRENPGLAMRTFLAMRRGITKLSMGALQTLSNVGIATLSNLGERLGSDSMREKAQVWDKRMQMFEKLRKLSQEELRPLILPEEAQSAASYLITAAEAVPSAVLSCCGGAGFTALTLGTVGETVAAARERAPMAAQELQLYAGLLAGAIQAGIYLNLNRVGGRLLEQSISRIGRASGQGVAGYALAGLNVMGNTTVEAAKLLAAGKLAQTVDLGSQEIAARLSRTASNINWQEFGENLVDVEANMHEAAGLLPFLLLGSGRLALQHFRSPRAILGDGQMLGAWGIPKQQQEAILAERNIALKSNMLQEAISGSKMWSGIAFMPSAWRALKLLHSDSFHEFRNAEQVHDFLKLPPPARSYKPQPDAKLPYSPEKLSGNNPRMMEAMNLWNKWWVRSRVDETPTAYPDLSLFPNIRQMPTDYYTKLRQHLSPLKYALVPRRVRELGIYAPHAEAERQVILKDRMADLESLSYQCVMNLYSIDTLTHSDQSIESLQEQSENTRKDLLKAVSRAVVDTARGVPQEQAQAELEKYVSDLYMQRKYKSAASPIPPALPDRSPDNADSPPLPMQDTNREMADAARLISGLHIGVDSLISLLPRTSDFQTALTRGLSPAEAYTYILNRDLGQSEKINSTPGEDIRNITPMAEYTRHNAGQFEVYSQLSGTAIEHTTGEDSMTYSRSKRPDGSYTHWHEQDAYVMNDVAGNAALLFAPFGHHKNMLELHTHDGKNVNLLNKPEVGSMEFTGYDQLCSLAKHELGELWMEKATDMQPGLQMERMRRFFRSTRDNDGVTPMIHEVGYPGNKYKVDILSDATPLSMAQARFYVYWQRMINSGYITPEEMGDFLVKQGHISADERHSILNPTFSAFYWRGVKKNDRAAAKRKRKEIIPRTMAEKMAEYTTLRFLSQLPKLPLPKSVKTWVGMAAFCPEAPALAHNEKDEPTSIEIKGNGTGLISWANRTVAKKLRDMAPQVDAMRQQLAERKNFDPLFESLLGDAMGLDNIRRSEQGWCYHICGAPAVNSAPQSFWNLLRSPLRAWDRMSRKDRVAIGAHIEELCKREPLASQLQKYGSAPIPAAITMLDDLLREYPQMHLYGTANNAPDRIRSLKLHIGPTPDAKLNEPEYEPLPLYESNELQAGCELNAYSSEMPEFIMSDDRVYPGLLLLNELRTYPSGLPHVYNDGIWWKNRLYGMGGKCPIDSNEYYAERPLEPLLNMLQSVHKYRARQGVIKICGIKIEGLDDNLDLHPLRLITIYRSKADRRQMFRLMPGDSDTERSSMRSPYLVHCKNGEYLENQAVERTTQDMDKICVPLHEYAPAPGTNARISPDIADPEALRADWINASWEHNLEQTLQHCAKAADPNNDINYNVHTLEYLMRLAEDSGFSPSVAEVNPRTLSMGQARLLGLTREMIASLCSSAPDEANKRLAAMAQELLNKPTKKEELLRAIRYANSSVPGTHLGGMLEMENVILDELDKAAQEWHKRRRKRKPKNPTPTVEQ